MKKADVSIIGAKFGLKKISINYYDNVFGQNRTAEEVDYPQPGLIKARDELRKDLANSFHSADRDTEEKFSVKAFDLAEKDDVKTVEIAGLMNNPHGYIDKVKTKILLSEDQADLQLKLETLKTELYQFIFEGKTAEGKILGFEDPQGEDMGPTDDPRIPPENVAFVAVAPPVMEIVEGDTQQEQQ